MIQDPTERAAVENHIRQHFEDVATAERQERVEAYTKAGQIVEQSGDLYKVPLVIRQKLSPDELTTLAHQADRIRHPKTDTNPDLFYSLLNLTALNDLTRADFAARDLSKDRANLSDEHYDFLLKRQIAIRTEMLNARAAEAKRQSDQAGKASASDARIEALIEQTDPAKRAGVAAIFRSQMSPALQQKYNLNAPVPGAPIVRTPPNEQRPSRPAPDAPPNWTVRVPQALLDRAARDPEYKLYLQHMGVTVP